MKRTLFLLLLLLAVAGMGILWIRADTIGYHRYALCTHVYASCHAGSNQRIRCTQLHHIGFFH